MQQSAPTVIRTCSSLQICLSMSSTPCCIKLFGAILPFARQGRTTAMKGNVTLTRTCYLCHFMQFTTLLLHPVRAGHSLGEALLRNWRGHRFSPDNGHDL